AQDCARPGATIGTVPQLARGTSGVPGLASWSSSLTPITTSIMPGVAVSGQPSASPEAFGAASRSGDQQSRLFLPQRLTALAVVALMLPWSTPVLLTSRRCVGSSVPMPTNPGFLLYMSAVEPTKSHKMETEKA